MRVTVLTVPGCPNAPVVRERITAALALACGQGCVDVVEVADEAEAARWGMTGSPTVLVDGVDPFAAPGARPSISCRIYRGSDGAADGAPSVPELRRALEHAAMTTEGEHGEIDVFDPLGRGGRGRLAPNQDGLRAVHQAVLRHFATIGRVPALEELEAAAAPSGRTAREVIGELAREDFLTLDQAGDIKAAYPFSAVPTRHRVRLAEGAQVWSMCAIDALGIPAMLGTDAVITSTDPVTAEPITVSATPDRATWQPHSAVVFVGRRDCCGPAASVCCDALNFFTSTEIAHDWAQNHPEYIGYIIGQTQAEQLGRSIFGPLLTAD